MSRNLIIHGMAAGRLEDIVEWAGGYIDDFQNSNVPLSGTNGSRMQINHSRWIPPPPTKYLLNSDAAIDRVRGVVGIGLAIRNSDGNVMAVSAQCIFASYSPMVAEAVAIFKGIQLTCEASLVPLDLSSDAAVVVKMVNDHDEHVSEVGLVIDAIRGLLMSLPGCVLQFAPRATNFVAHSLAKFALDSVEDCVWIEDFPPCIRSFLIADAPGCI